MKWRQTWSEARARKFRQAAFVYLHVAVLYEAAAYVMLGAGLLPERFGPPVIYLFAGAAFAAAIVWSLYSLQNVWVARVVWAVHGLRLPALISGAFLVSETSRLPPSFYLAAIVVVVANLWMLARAGWDL